RSEPRTTSRTAAAARGALGEPSTRSLGRAAAGARMVHAVLVARRAARSSISPLASFSFLIVCLLGAFHTPVRSLGVEHLALAALWLVLFARRASTRFAAESKGRLLPRHDLEMGFLLLAFVYAVVQLGGGLTGQLYPLVYVLVAFVASFAQKPMGSALVIVAVVFEALLYFVTERHLEAEPYFLHATFIVFFGLMNLLFTRAEIERVRERSRRQLDEEKLKTLEDARRYRLISVPRDATERDEERLTRSSVEEVHQALYYTLDLLRRTLDLYTCVLLMLDEDGERFRIVELCSSSDDIAEGPFKGGEGAVGAVIKRGMTMNLEHIKPGYRGLCYYKGPARTRAFVGAPVIENGRVLGAVCGDRLEDRPFTPRDEAVLEGAAQHILRTIENERVFVQLERTKSEQTVLHQASQALGAALTEDAVIDAGLKASAQIAPFDFAAVTRYEPEHKRHSVRRAVGEGSEDLKNLSFRDNASLTAMAVKNRHYLPYRGEFDGQKQVVYTRTESMRGMQSLLILPLLVREDPVGTLALAAKRPEAFNAQARQTLQVMANQLAVALANAESVRRLEQLATTDGLTGCLNKRAFLDELEKRLKVAERFGKKLSLIVTDIDHFKSVNDTYGHAVGDHVIRGLGEILRNLKRETDVVGRFGGEEFCILCEETDAQGAVQLAERVREQLRERVFESDLGKLRVTCSLGVAQFPDDAKTDSQLFEVADKALYLAKQTGRDRVCTARKM
ncbi:MAG TPA: diguanylate cyclase, partial [Polyangiales bacterium]